MRKKEKNMESEIEKRKNRIVKCRQHHHFRPFSATDRKRRSEFLNSLLFKSFTSHQEVHQRGILLQFFAISIQNVQHSTVVF